MERNQAVSLVGVSSEVIASSNNDRLGGNTREVGSGRESSSSLQSIIIRRCYQNILCDVHSFTMDSVVQSLK